MQAGTLLHWDFFSLAVAWWVFPTRFSPLYYSYSRPLRKASHLLHIIATNQHQIAAAASLPHYAARHQSTPSSAAARLALPPPAGNRL